MDRSKRKERNVRIIEALEEEEEKMFSQLIIV
jgi:hypothetical protein